MKTWLAWGVMALCWSLFQAGESRAATAGYQCASCHGTTSEVLPAKHIKKNDFSGCFACHVTGRPAGTLAGMLHGRHLSAATVNPETCKGCHPAASGGVISLSADGGKKVRETDLPDLAQKTGNWLKSDTLSHAHRNKGVSCGECHTTYDEDDSYNKRCIGCHGSYDVMAKKTAKTRFSRNPHKSHYPTLKCTNCHQSHAGFKDFCATCHGFGFSWPVKAQ
ncbi:MAG: cytochrome c3 family protein [Desulfuromonadales bacterium]|nr:cytochrome c3 family protein [Desulfuromonadales bacterium]